MVMIKFIGWLIIFHQVWLEIDAHLEWLNELEYWKLKYEIKDLLFVAFQQKKLEPWSHACLGVGYLYTIVG
jgi:hypothetical protein